MEKGKLIFRHRDLVQRLSHMPCWETLGLMYVDGMPISVRQLSYVLDSTMTYLSWKGHDTVHPSEMDLAHISQYLAYYIHAPCWEEVFRKHEEAEHLEELKKTSLDIDSWEKVDHFIHRRLLPIGLDPI